MNPKVSVTRSGLQRGWIEFRHTFTNGPDLWDYVFPPILMFTILMFLRRLTVPGTDFSLGAMALPSMLGGFLVFALVLLAALLTVEREDGTLLRAKAIPEGMVGYLIGKLVLVIAKITVAFALVLTSGLILFEDLALDSAGSWFTLLWVYLLGMVAILPFGAILGSLFSNPQHIGMLMLPVLGLVGASGIFYPVTQFPVWVQGIVQVFPVYWLGLGMRSALLPDSLAVVEIGESWRHLEIVGVLSVWAVVGLLAAPIVLRRMARRESGSSMQDRKTRALQRPS